MTYAEAMQIWHDCYIAIPSLWSQYTTEQKLEAIRVKNGDDMTECTYGYFNISDRD